MLTRKIRRKSVWFVPCGPFWSGLWRFDKRFLSPTDFRSETPSRFPRGCHSGYPTISPIATKWQLKKKEPELLLFPFWRFLSGESKYNDAGAVSQVRGWSDDATKHTDGIVSIQLDHSTNSYSVGQRIWNFFVFCIQNGHFWRIESKCLNNRFEWIFHSTSTWLSTYIFHCFFHPRI